MSHSSTDMTGILMLDAVTPIINALFGSFSVTDNGMEKGYAFINNIDSQSTWGTVEENLNELIGSLGLSTDKDLTVVQCITLLAKHLNVSLDESVVKAWEQNIDNGNQTDISEVFRIASLLNDGHGLTGMKLETAGYSDKARLDEFGGAGYFQSQQVVISGSSYKVANLGERVHRSLVKNDTDAAAKEILTSLNNTLDGIIDPVKRTEVAIKLIQLLVTA